MNNKNKNIKKVYKPTKNKMKMFIKDYIKLCKKHNLIFEIGRPETVYINQYNAFDELVLRSMINLIEDPKDKKKEVLIEGINQNEVVSKEKEGSNK